MKKEKIIQKLKIKDYNKELEEILLNKTFSKNTKNLLSSMFYKIENSYEDYKKTKVQVSSKKEFLEELINIINKDCKEIEIIKPNLEEENKKLKGKKSIYIKEEQKIITYQNELALLNAIYKLKASSFNMRKNTTIKENAIFELLNKGAQIAKCEVIRDFDGWSWNIMTEEIENHTANLVYQYIIYLIGYDFFNKNTGLEQLEELLKKKYKDSLVEKILKTLSQLAILNFLKQNPDDKKLIEDIRDDLQKKIELMNNKKIYIEQITNKKKECIKNIEKIDKYINDDLALKKEYIKQNEILSQEERVFSLSDFSEKIQKQREELTEQIEKLTAKIKPKNYVSEKAIIEKELNVIKELNLEEPNTETFIQQFVDLALKGLKEQIEKIESKKEILEKISILRYLKFVNINNKKTAGEECKKQFEKIEKNLVTKGCNLKALNIFSKNIEENYKIYKNIFNSKIIDLENAYIEISKGNIVLLYDENSLEKEEKHDNFKELTIKFNKKTKIFM